MTVCVAAIFEHTGVIGACDRMLSAGDIDFEPNLPKIRYLTRSCGTLLAGDINLQTDITNAVMPIVNARIAANPSEWLLIRDIARIYKDEVDQAIFQLAEDRILFPVGLTRATFLSRQRELIPEFVKDIAQELLNFQGPVVETILMGVDTSGPHIFVVSNDSLQCCDSVGFAAIGTGHWHAESQMMLFGHTLRHSFADTLLSVYFAKRRSEIAPGVGVATDMCFVLGLGGIDMVGEHITAELEKRYGQEKRSQQRIAYSSRKKVNTFVEGLLNAPPPPVQEQRELPSPTDAASPSSDKKD